MTKRKDNTLKDVVHNIIPPAALGEGVRRGCLRKVSSIAGGALQEECDVAVSDNISGPYPPAHHQLLLLRRVHSGVICVQGDTPNGHGTVSALRKLSCD